MINMFPIQIKVPGTRLLMVNLCEKEFDCDGVQSAVGELVASSRSCQSYAAANATVWQIESGPDNRGGVGLYMKGSVLCHGEAVPRYPTFTAHVLCGDEIEPVVQKPVHQPECSYTVTMTTSAACPHKLGSSWSLRSVWAWVSVVTLLTVAYCFGVYMYNRCRQGKTGAEAIPHIEVWRSAGALATCRRCRSEDPLEKGLMYDNLETEDGEGGLHQQIGDDDL